MLGLVLGQCLLYTMPATGESALVCKAGREKEEHSDWDNKFLRWKDEAQS